MIELVHVADLNVAIGEPIEIGMRRVIPIRGGEVSGPRIRGRILPGGADFQILRDDGVIELHARYVVECENDSRIYVENSGLRHGLAEAVYFRTTPRFETADQAHLWLTRYVFVGSGVRHPDRVELAIYQVT
jgi:hypothetical protein